MVATASILYHRATSNILPFYSSQQHSASTSIHQSDKMRFQDWDVLLFPAGSQVPIREFRTACFAQQDGLTTTPLLTCFVPSLEAHAPFQISMHSWTRPVSILAPNAGYATGTSYVWRIKIAVDGLTVVNETFPEDVTWPRQLGKTIDRQEKCMGLSTAKTGYR